MTVFRDNPGLLERFRRGERDALERVYLHYVDRVASVVRWGILLPSGKKIPGVADPESEQDIVHDVFLRAFSERARAGFDGARPFEPYLLRIAANLLVDHYRRGNREILPDRLDQDQPIEPAPEDPVEPGNGHPWSELRAETALFLDGLDGNLKKFAHLRFEWELSQQQIAAEMGTSRWKVRMLEKKVLRGLVRHLKKNGKWPQK